jgi:NAD(P)-dependent dehydrogenase (short-subunit alcohol dehydrogenase family)
VTDTWSPPDLRDAVALVTGASRGVGRGIATALGGAGATVYVTGRSSRAGCTTEGLAGTVEDTADAVTAAGGTGVPVRCDHEDDDQVDALFDLIDGTHGRLDLVVNNVWAGYERSADVRFDAPFWEQPVWRYDLFAASLRAQYVAAARAARLMVAAGRGLIAGVTFVDGDTYLGQAAYDTMKFAGARLHTGFAAELRRHGVGAVCVVPGLVRTERLSAVWPAVGSGPAAVAHSPEFVGRAIAALLADPDGARWWGSTTTVSDLAAHYGFTDTDGSTPPPFRLTGRMSLATRMARLHRPPLAAPAERGR